MICYVINIHVQAMFNITGGRPGSLGLNLLIQNGGKIINLGSKATVTVNAGVRHVSVVLATSI